ncbi:hypothetical protein [Azospirillum sp. TSO5]|uniref:argonaute/piwi family protein n=1 Tax=Azospirillum sp. TSO5 TaxID=716760 RepID=UPI000D61E508|nr:hypothetical protein [Azospirillum sp. TSO5]PWC92654.1 hypothetical protein TSO5_17185 [Azospirillum sp. TSO5]
MPPQKFVLNAAPICFPDRTRLRVGVLPYDEETLRRLRAELAGRVLLKRDSKNGRILAVALTSDIDAPGTATEIDPADNPGLVASLASEAVLRHMRNNQGYTILNSRPLRVLAKKLGNLYPPEAPPWLEKRIVLTFETRVVARSGRAPGPMLLCDARVRNVIGEPCSRLLEFGVPLIGRYVAVRQADYDSRIEDRLRIVGRVVAVEGGLLRLDDHADGYPVVHAREAFLETKRENMAACVQALLGSRASRLLRDVDAIEAEQRRGDNRAALMKASLGWIRRQNIELAPGVLLQLGPVAERSRGDWFPRIENLSKPTLVFNPSGVHTDTWSQRGIDTHGPYDQRDFTPKRLRIAVICQAQHRGETSEFVARFLEGMPDARRPGRDGMPDMVPHGRGFIRRFGLTDARVETFVASGTGADAYASACRQALEAAVEGGFEWDFAFVQISADFRLLPGSRNPYFVTKAILLKRGIQVQEVTLDTIRMKSFPLACAMSNISLAVYAKIGGVPWLLRSQPNTDHELVIGLGSHTVKAGRFGAGERTVGITTVFTSEGRYLLEDRTAAVPFDQYATELQRSLKRTITRVREEDAWRSSDAVRLVFHVFKPFKGREAEAIERTVADLGLDRVSFAFIHVVDDHPYVLFDEGNSGVRSGDSWKGIYAPVRGTVAELNDEEALLTLTGAKELKLAGQGIPAPLLLRLHRKSSFRDLRYLTRQAYDFACHSWRMFDPSPLPITILYSDLIAQMLTGLRDTAEWDPDAMWSPTGRTRWFL